MADVSELFGLRDAVRVALDRLHEEADEHDIAAARIALRDALGGGSYLQEENEVLKQRLAAYRICWAQVGVGMKLRVYESVEKEVPEGLRIANVNEVILEDLREAWGRRAEQG